MWSEFQIMRSVSVLVTSNTQFHSFFSYSWLYVLLVRAHVSDMMVHSNLLAILKQLQVLI